MISHKPDKGITGATVEILSKDGTNPVRQFVGTVLLRLGMWAGKMFIDISGLDFGMDIQDMTKDGTTWGIVCDGEQITVSFEEDEVKFPVAAVRSALIWLLNRYHVEINQATHSGDRPI